MHSSWVNRLKAEKPKGNLAEAQARGDLQALASLFMETKNSSAAWLCWHLAQKWQLDAPKAVVDEVDRFVSAIANIAAAALDGDSGSKINDKLVAQLWTPAGPSGRFSERLLCWNRDFGIALKVFDRRDVVPNAMSLTQAVEEVAEKEGMEVENVTRIYNEHREAIIAAQAELEGEQYIQHTGAIRVETQPPRG